MSIIGFFFIFLLVQINKKKNISGKSHVVEIKEMVKKHTRFGPIATETTVSFGAINMG